MRKYIVKYENHDGDLCTVWLTADSREDAKTQARAEYWDIKDILQIIEIRHND